MEQKHDHSGHVHDNLRLEEIQTQLSQILAKLEHDVPLHLFLSDDKDSPFNQAAKEILQTISRISPRIPVLEHRMDDDLAKEKGITSSPTILFDPDHYGLRWLGAPLGEEGRMFIEALVMLGNQKSNLSEQSRKILERITSPRHVQVFVSMTCPYCPQQAMNVLKTVVARPDLITLDIVDVQSNPDLADRYSAYSTPMTYANDEFIGKGAQPEELFLSSLEKLEEQAIFIPDVDAEEIETDLLIIGGGPAGLSAGIYAARAGLNAAILERGVLGGLIATTPEVENYPGIARVGGKTLVEIMVAHALEYCQIFPGEDAVRITVGERFEVLTTRRRFLTKVVLLATGADHKHLHIPDEERLGGRGVSYCATCDGPQFQAKKVILVGGGNGAVTEALHLKNIDVDVTLVHRRDKLRAQEHLVKKLQAENIPVLWNTEVKEIRGDKRVEEVVLVDNRTGKTSTMKLDGIFISIGYQPEVEIARQAGVELTPDGYIQSDRRHRTNVPGIYAAGDVEGQFKQIVTAAAYGSEAAMAIFEDLINPYWTTT
ncbi:MAG: FAD-dependent oxidoreductase [Candidatus Aminicenantaceae bacterium]